MQSIDTISKLAPVFTTLLLGIFGTFISFYQYKVNQAKLRLDLFDKRLEAYGAVQRYFSILAKGSAAIANSDDAFKVLYKAENMSQFLFDNDVLKYIDEIKKSAFRMRDIHFLVDGPDGLPVGDERSKLCKELAEISKWNKEQCHKAPALYSKYMRIKI